MNEVAMRLKQKLSSRAEFLSREIGSVLLSFSVEMIGQERFLADDLVLQIGDVLAYDNYNQNLAEGDEKKARPKKFKIKIVLDKEKLNNLLDIVREETEAFVFVYMNGFDHLSIPELIKNKNVSSVLAVVWLNSRNYKYLKKYAVARQMKQ